jgi:hypothetical protein
MVFSKDRVCAGALGLVLLGLWASSAEGASIAIEHSLDEGHSFVPGGIITFDAVVRALLNRDAWSLHLCRPCFLQGTDKQHKLPPPQRPGATATLERAPLTAEQEAQLRELVAKDGLYRLRLPSALVSDAGSQTVSTSFPARCLTSAAADGGLALDLLDGRRVAAIAITSPCSRIAAPADGLQLPAAQALELRMPSAAPDVLPLLMQSAQAGSGAVGAAGTTASPSAEQQRSQQEAGSQHGKKDEGDKGKAKEEEKTWLQKNWMVVMPLGFIVSGGQQDFC